MRSLSPAVAEALLILIALAAGLLLWLWASGLTGGEGGNAAAGAFGERLLADTLSVRRSSGGSYCVYIVLQVRNVGSTTVRLDPNTSFYLLSSSGGHRAWPAPPIPVELGPGEGRVLLLVPSGMLSGVYAARVVSLDGLSASAGVPGCARTVAGYAFLVPAVDGYNVSYTLPLNVTLSVSVTAVTATDYRVTYRIEWPAGVVADYGYAEVFTRNMTHPRYAAYPVVEHWGPVPGPNYWSNYWQPLLHSPGLDEFPATVVLGVVYHRG